MTGALSYLYAVGDAALADDPAVTALRGVDDAPVRAVAKAGLAAVISPVSAARFGAEALRAAMEDLRWLEETARAHHAVVDALAEARPLAPVRLATVYLGEDNVRALLATRAGELAAVLATLRGRAEWGVKGFAPPAAAPTEPTAPAGTGPGTSYLLRRRAERERAGDAQRLAQDAAERADRELRRLAVAGRRYPPQDPRLSGRRDPMLLNAAYLVPAEATDAVRRLVERWRDPHLRLELTGPWAAYSFATVEQP